MNTRNFLLFFSLFSTQLLFSQENQGLVHDNYNPVNGQYINPSNLVDSKVWLDINGLGANSYFRNNAAFFPDANWLNFESLNQDIEVKTTLRNIRLYTDVEVRGPAISVQLGKNAISVFTGARGVVNINRIPGELAKYAINETLEQEDIGEYEFRNGRIKTMAWGEVGITFGRILAAKNNNLWTAAVSVKRLYGVQQTNLLVRSANVIVREVDEVDLISTDGKFSFAEPALDAGRGFGLSAGIHYKKMKTTANGYIPHWKRTGCEYREYQYKVGVSLLDIGFVNFTTNSFSGKFDETLDIDNISDIDELSENLNSSKNGDKVRSWLPSAISAQVDYNVNDQIYLNTTLVQKFPFMSNVYGVERTNLLAVSARYESRFLGLGIPISLENYTNPQIGLALRVFNLSVGSDNLLPFFVEHNELLAGDFYFSLKFKLVNNPACKNRNSSKKSRKHNRNQKRKNSVDCPTF
jgi:hypothetical protein